MYAIRSYYVETNPKPDMLDDTYLLLGAALYDSQQFSESRNNFV